MTLGEYIFFPCDEGAGPTLTSSGDASVSLDLAAGTEAAAWANSGYVTFDGTVYFRKLCSDLSTAAQNILGLDDSIIFSWAIINAASQSGATALYRVGGGDTGQPGYEARINANDYPAGRVRDESGVEDVSASNSTSLNEDYLVCWVFNNTELVKQAYFYRKFNQSLGNVDLSNVGAAPLSTESNDYFSIGAGVFAGSAQLQIVGKVKNIGFMNLGSKMPAGIDDFVIQLNQNGGTLA